jgi:hypothetical protein
VGGWGGSFGTFDAKSINCAIYDHSCYSKNFKQGSKKKEKETQQLPIQLLH